ncbi:hypothetical protein ABZ252_21545 [Streptomyces sp. NPDC006175]
MSIQASIGTAGLRESKKRETRQLIAEGYATAPHPGAARTRTGS